MIKFNTAFREFLSAQFIKNTKPRLVFLNGNYIVTWFFSESTIKRIGGVVIL